MPNLETQPRFGIASTIGARTVQQDCVKGVWLGPVLCVALADGVGSRPNGRDASKSAVDAALRWVQENSEAAANGDLNGAVAAADRAIQNLNALTNEEAATTFVLALFGARRIRFCSVGDSHLFRIRCHELHMLTSQQQATVRAQRRALQSGSEDDWAEVRNLSRPRALTDALVGSGQHTVLRGTSSVHPGDTFIISSDGLESLSFDALRDALPVLVERFEDLNAAAAWTLKGVESLGRKDQDNASLGLIHYPHDWARRQQSYEEQTEIL